MLFRGVEAPLPIVQFTQINELFMRFHENGIWKARVRLEILVGCDSVMYVLPVRLWLARSVADHSRELAILANISFNILLNAGA